MSQPSFMNKPLKVRAAVVLLHEGHVLLMRQNNRDFWVYPGGTLEEGETVANCAVRELLEEVNLAVTLQGLLAVTDFADSKRQVVDVTYLATCTQAPPQTFIPPFVENINEVCWVPVAELSQWVVQPAHLHAHVCQHLQQDATLQRATAPLC
ncbi:MAG: NUDIX hydrolase [Vampirovibrionales bacterium]